MSTTARKLRKRIQRETGTKFQHPVKEGTPVIFRHENQPRQIFGAGMGVAPTRHGITGKMARRIRNYVEPELANYSDAQREARKAQQEQPQEQLVADKGLDPKPVRLGRKRLTLQEGQLALDAGEDAVFSPRKGYTQQSTAYPTI